MAVFTSSQPCLSVSGKDAIDTKQCGCGERKNVAMMKEVNNIALSGLTPKGETDRGEPTFVFEVIELQIKRDA